MSTEKKYTERDLVLAQREACAKEMASRLLSNLSLAPDDDPWVSARAYAARAYPLPKVERPRVVGDPGDKHNARWMVVAGALRLHIGATFSRKSAEFRPWTYWLGDYHAVPIPARVAMWADLLAHPIEEVDDDGTDGSAS